MPLKDNTTYSKQRFVDTGMAVTLIAILLFIFSKNEIFLYLSLLTLLINMTIPVFYKPLAFLWFGLSRHLGMVVSTVILTAIFLILIIPVGNIRKVLGKDSMRLKEWKKGSSSVFSFQEHKFDKKSMEKPF